MSTNPPTILHICTRDVILGLRDQIFRLHGYEVDSTLRLDEGLKLAKARKYSLVIVDVEGDGRIPSAEKLCSEIKEHRPDQEVAFICNYRVSVQTDCPDEIIRSEFNPQAMIDGVKAALEGQEVDQ
jgi:DNA-binding response OmpR family regulator